MDQREVVVVGAGAAGLWAAERVGRAARERGRAPDVLVLEKTPRAGTKVLASGGTHCNLTTTLPAADAARLFGRRGERFLRRALREVSPGEVRRRFAQWGVPTVEAPLEKVFPASGRARDVRDALVAAARAAGAELRLSAGVVAVAPAHGGTARWEVRLEDGGSVRAGALVLAPGGRSYPRTGTTGDGYGWLAALDLEVVEPLPALAPLASPAPWVHALTGIAVQGAEVRLVDGDGAVHARRRRPLLFTHRGVSGPGPMDVSGEVAARAGTELHLAVDLLPDVDRGALVGTLREAAGASGAPRVGDALPEPLPRRLLAAVARQAGVEPDARCNALARARRHAFIEALKGLAVPLSGTEGFERAEVTRGGLALSALDPGTMEVRGRPGLFVCGELLDLDGPIGGLNFQAAFATAELAGRAAAGPCPER